VILERFRNIRDSTCPLYHGFVRAELFARARGRIPRQLESDRPAPKVLSNSWTAGLNTKNERKDSWHSERFAAGEKTAEKIFRNVESLQKKLADKKLK
jgi:hypothetical protein